MRVAVFPWCVLFFLGFGCATGEGGPERTHRLAIIGGTLIDGTSRVPRPRTTILVRDNRVEWIGPDSAVLIPPDTEVVDARGLWVIPGLIDCHVHLASTQTLQGVVQEEVQKLLDGFLLCGVTSILDCWATEEIFVLRGLEREGRIVAPRIFATGPGISAPGSHGTQFGVAHPRITSPEEARARVRELAALDADLIKVAVDGVPGDGGVVPSLDRATFRAVVEEAHRLELKVGVHVLSGELAAQVVEDGADCLLHAFDGPGLPADVLRKFRIRSGIMVPTLVVEEPFLRLRDDPGFVQEPSLVRAVDPRVLRRFPRRALAGLQGTTFERAARHFPRVAENVGHLVRTGCRVAAGSDAGNLAVFHGPGLQREAELLVKVGMTPQAVLQSLTREGARLLGQQGEIGTVAPGSLADLVILGGDPLEDIRNLRQVEAVVKNGRSVDLEALRERIQGTVVRPLDTRRFADFEDKSPFATAGSRFIGVIESGPAPHSTAEIGMGRESKNDYLQVRGEVAPVPFAFGGVAVHLAPFGLHAVDLDASPVLRFRARGDGGSYLLELITLDCGEGVFARAFRAGKEWGTVEIKLDRLRRVFVPRSMPLDLSRCLTLRVITGTNRQGAFAIDLDDIRFVSGSR